jgi:hypothetical protein
LVPGDEKGIGLPGFGEAVDAIDLHKLTINGANHHGDSSKEKQHLQDSNYIINRQNT